MPVPPKAYCLTWYHARLRPLPPKNPKPPPPPPPRPPSPSPDCYDVRRCVRLHRHRFSAGLPRGTSLEAAGCRLPSGADRDTERRLPLRAPAGCYFARAGACGPHRRRPVNRGCRALGHCAAGGGGRRAGRLRGVNRGHRALCHRAGCPSDCLHGGLTSASLLDGIAAAAAVSLRPSHHHQVVVGQLHLLARAGSSASWESLPAWLCRRLSPLPSCAG